ncbi:peptidase S11 D-alanyl-D-alanine carboxypeptidase 1 [Paenibacillus curdlanolyticus YK9]|uniref:Peptidase S11 D-alanyl-D-alanine carboxypeptidase 1 n=1 Tax=Paenibacillus curdlanolyticus YK9 TaxID=717606 RepID=E0ICD3_9BACL|nr:D-alanyl-D-alanine carboxypeptidase family protein [Paenibacillus curdlanolyticus]EFM09819.1 peptidase S11 D-alanyl-D-alanine carboxypeptidase 1 [Paenibacillus curdlanolyticus YK9]
MRMDGIGSARWRRQWLVAAALLLLFSLAPLPSSGNADAAAANVSAISTQAKAAAIIDVESGRLLYSKNGDEPMRIASLTKIMTAIVAIENGNLADKVKVSVRAAGKEGSSIYLRAGEVMKLEDMLYGLMLRSGNDAATAIAEHVGGSIDGFVKMMNEKAEWIGLKHSRFMNPSGLDEDGHLSTANDLAKLTAYALHNPTFAAIVKTRVKKAPNPNEQWDYSWSNKNKMLAMYEGADGVKTGYTKAALRCLVSSATRNGQQLAAVTINDRNDWADHRSMLDWGFQHYVPTVIAKQGQPISGYTLAAGQSFRFPLAKGEASDLHSKLILLDPQSSRYALGERGVLQWELSGEVIGAIPVYETGSERLSWPDKKPIPAVEHATSAQVEAGSSFRTAIQAVVRALFGGGA